MNTAIAINPAHYIGRSQALVIARAMHGTEGQWFRDKLAEIAEIIRAMPTSGQTDGQGVNAIAHLHYFAGGQANWYITERDIGSAKDADPGVQHQAFGLADLFGDGGETGYINIAEIITNGGEIDLHWMPRSIADIHRLAA